MVHSGWQMVPDTSLIINNVIMTSLLLLKISYVLANFLVLPYTLLFEYFSLQGKKLDFAKKFNK